MNRFCLWHRRYLCGSFLFFWKDENVHDALEDPPEFVPRNGFERVYKVFADEAPGWPSKASVSMLQLMGGSFLFGFVIGGMKRGNRAYGNFIIANQHTKFITPYEAKRKMHDTVFLNFISGGVFWGIKAALFTGIYSFCVIAIPAFRNTKEGVLEYAVGGALAGGLSRAYLGVKAALASATVVAAGASLIGIFALISSTPMSEVRNMQYTWYEWRRKRLENAYEDDRKTVFGRTLPDFFGMRDRRLKQKDTSGYSEGETVYIAMADPDEVSEPSKPKAEDKNTTVAAVVHETTSNDK